MLWGVNSASFATIGGMLVMLGVLLYFADQPR